MKDIEKEIWKHYRNQEELKKIYMGNDNINYEKTRELQKQQDEEYKKFMFLKKLSEAIRDEQVCNSKQI